MLSIVFAMFESALILAAIQSDKHVWKQSNA